MDIGKSQLITYITDWQFIRSILIEVAKGITTFILGLISFNLFERYKNKKENNKVYIQFLKLEKELAANKGIIEETLNEYIEVEVLNMQLYINNVYSNELFELYSKVIDLDMYKTLEEVLDKNGDFEDMIDVYNRIPRRIIADIQSGIASIENNDNYSYEDAQEIADFREQLASYEKKNIFDDLIDLEIKAEKFLNEDFRLVGPIKFLHSKLKKFNSLDGKEKHKYLDKFCSLILEDENEFTISLKNFSKLLKLTNKLAPNNRHSELKLEFNRWETIDLELLAVYDAELYLKLEELYLKLNTLKIYVNNKKSLEDVDDVIINELEPIIIKNKNRLKKILLKTNKLFKSV